MDTTLLLSKMYTQLVDRKLWFDGDVSIDPQNLLPFIQKYPEMPSELICVDRITADIEKYNKINGDVAIKLKSEPRSLSTKWKLPEKYLTLDLDQYVVQKLQDETHSMSSADKQLRIKRVVDELEAYHNFHFEDQLRTIIYIVDQFIEHNTVWGLGRGSSVSSYVLYLLGAHDIDSVQYHLNFKDFLRNEE